MRVLYPETGLWQAKELGVHVLWMSDSPDSPTGFGNVTRFVCSGLADLGHRVSILGWQTKGTPIVWHSCQLYPTGYSDVGADVLLFYLQRLRPDVLITLGNVWWLSWITHPLIAANGVPWWLYYPLDGDCGEGRLPESWVQVLRRVDLPVAMSRYGSEETARNGVAPAYIPHGVDTGLLRPPAVKAEAKASFGYRERFVILSDARNQARKLLPRTLEIFRRFAAGKPDVVLHLHCDPDDPSARRPTYRYDLRADVDFLAADGRVRITPGMSLDSGGIPVEDLGGLFQAAGGHLLACWGGTPVKDLPRLSQAAYVHLLASWGEVFGLPTLQAAAAGVVPVAVDYAASRELVLAPGAPPPARHFLPSEFGVRAALIDIDAAVARLEALYADRAALARKGAAAARFAAAYDWRNVIAHWDDLLRREVGRVPQETPDRAAATVSGARSGAGQPPVDPHASATLSAGVENYLAGLALQLHPS